MGQRLHSIIFLGSLVATSLLFGSSQYTNIGRGLMAIPATIIFLIAPDDVAAGPVAHLATLIWFFFCALLILVLAVGVIATALLAAWSIFRAPLTTSLQRKQSWIQVSTSVIWILGLMAFDAYPVSQTPPWEQSTMFYIFPAVMLLNAVSQTLRTPLRDQS